MVAISGLKYKKETDNRKKKKKKRKSRCIKPYDREKSKPE